MTLRILYVCTANICRSASAERLLREAVVDDPRLADVEIRSAGTAAIAGLPGCHVAPALRGYSEQHASQPLTSEAVSWASLILTAAREHQEGVLHLVPSARSRTFTIRQSGRIAGWMLETGMVAAGRERGAAQDAEATADAWAERFPPGDPRAQVAPLGAAGDERWSWLVDELDAARGMVAVAPPLEVGEGKRRWWRRATAAEREETGAVGGAESRHPDDVPDPHVLGMGLHDLAYQQIRGSTDALVRLLQEVAG